MKLIFNALAVTLFLPYHVTFDKVLVSLKMGDSVTLHTGVETNQEDVIKWYFNDTRIAQISGDQSKICTDDECKERFRDRLKLDHQTGSLTIMNITNTDSGEYELKIISNNDSKKIFSVSVTDVPAAGLHEMKERESVTLYSGVIKHPNDVMTWYFNEILITEISGDQSKICSDDECKERFRDRLKLDQTGSLTITNTRNTDSGDYELKIISSRFSITTVKRFSVSVTAVPDSGLSPAAVAGIVIVVLLVAAAAAAGVVYRRRTSHTAVPHE